MKHIWIILGFILLGLGIAGLFLPVLPTTPFLLLTAALWFKGSPRLYHKLLENKYMGSYIRNFRENRAIPLHAKIAAIGALWTTILLSAFLAVDVWWLRIVLICIAAAVTIHILSFKTLEK
jgi:uncharacterized membrane protein YbaN (DUF454 family)